ncbi:MAG: hypothetical protein IPK91_12320 [Saprospiraceae bacterium]|nr:hypothetical protein [Saprospiraceae bacterium]
MNSKNNNFNLFKDHLRTNGIPIDENPNFIRFFELAEEAVSHQLKNENVVSDIYNQTIIEIETGTNSINNYVVDELLKCHITILCTSKLMPFITSDNPGFVLHPNGKIETPF